MNLPDMVITLALGHFQWWGLCWVRGTQARSRFRVGMFRQAVIQLDCVANGLATVGLGAF
jgi:hypothetical protein